MESPLVSIISPTYNHAKFISECIDSVLKQSYKNWEMIIINDGSTDATAEIAQEYAYMDDRIQVINQSNKGVFKLGETYNTALAKASGKYIAILEGDDTWMPFKLQHQVDILEKNTEVILAWGQVAVVNHDFSETYNVSPVATDHNRMQLNNSPVGSIIELTTMGVWMAPQTILIRAEQLKSLGGFIQSHGMPLVDFPTFLALSLKGPFHFEEEILGSWRMYSTQTTKKYTTNIYLGRNEFIKEHLPKVKYLDVEKSKSILWFYERACLDAYARSGRYKLLRKQYKSARQDYLKAIFSPINGKFMWRLRALTGLVFSYLHMDVEGLARMMGKRTYKNIDD